MEEDDDAELDELDSSGSRGGASSGGAPSGRGWVDSGSDILSPE